MKKGIAILVCLMLLICFASLSLTACGDKLTLENYEKITCAKYNITKLDYEGGMSYKEVKKILGKHDSESSTSLNNTTAQVYTWGNTSKGIVVTFLNDTAILKTQVGLD